MTNKKSIIEDAKEELSVLIRSRYPIIYIISDEKEKSILEKIYYIGNSSNIKKSLYVWDIVRGLVKQTFNGDYETTHPVNPDVTDPVAILQHITNKDTDNNGIFVLADFHKYLERPFVQRLLKLFAEITINEQRKTIILLSTKNDGVNGSGKMISTELEHIITLLNWPYPDESLIQKYIKSTIPDINDKLASKNLKQINLKNEELIPVVNSCKGMTLSQIENAVTKSIVVTKSLDTKIISQEKKQIIHKSGLCDFIEPIETLSDIGGLENLKEWLKLRKDTMSEDAYEFGCDSPKGILLLGPWGSGKSSAVKAIINEWKIPGIRVDASQMYNMYVGGSESRTKQILMLAQSISPCVLWFDEVENLLASSSGNTSTDSGTSSRVVGLISTWMAEHTGTVFCAFTANDISESPPKLFRKGRLDEIFIVDLPVEQERIDIFKIHLTKKLRKQNKENLINSYDLSEFAKLTCNFSGAEIENIIDNAIRKCYSENKRELKNDDVFEFIKKTIPMACTMKEKIKKIREWQRGRAVQASKYDPEEISDFSYNENKKCNKRDIDL
jgi:ATP-dependent 26S proteasome regulatory subunit